MEGYTATAEIPGHGLEVPRLSALTISKYLLTALAHGAEFRLEEEFRFVERRL